MSQAPVLFEEKDFGGWITLNRPQALNALNFEMVDSMLEVLDQWEPQENIRYVVIQGQGRSFCAGGDLRALYHAHLHGQTREAFQFFEHEYRLNLRIHNYSKPIIALLHGITMGGGMGVSIHGTYRIVTENTVMAMPETSIGLFPDIGSAWFLNRCPGKTGLFVALTSYRMSHNDALYMGLGTHFVDSNHVEDLLAKIQRSQGEDLDKLFQPYANKRNDSFIHAHRVEIDDFFQHETLEDIFRALAASESQFAQETLARLKKRSPHSLRQTFDYFRKAEAMTIEEVMENDWKLASSWEHVEDLWEGIRAAVIDKDKNPKWISNPIAY